MPELQEKLLRFDTMNISVNWDQFFITRRISATQLWLTNLFLGLSSVFHLTSVLAGVGDRVGFSNNIVAIIAVYAVIVGYVYILKSASAKAAEQAAFQRVSAALVFSTIIAFIYTVSQILKLADARMFISLRGRETFGEIWPIVSFANMYAWGMFLVVFSIWFVSKYQEEYDNSATFWKIVLHGKSIGGLFLALIPAYISAVLVVKLIGLAEPLIPSPDLIAGYLLSLFLR